MNKFLFAIFFFLVTSKFAQCQDFKYLDYAPGDMDMKKYAKDTAANAVVLEEYGVAKINVASDDNIKILYDYHVKIKIFNAKAFDKGTVEIRLPIYNQSEDEVTELQGATTYLDDNGSTQRSELNVSSAFKVKQNKYFNVYKFTMPNLRNGCIVEYKYSMTSSNWGLFPEWHFQDDIPKMISRYDAFIPGFWNFNVALRGNLKLTKNKADLERGCFTTHGSSADCSHLTFEIDDIPAFIEEDYMTAPKNFMSAIYFQLADFTNPFTGVKKKWTQEWSDIDYNMKHSDYFGTQLKKKDQLKPYIAPVIAGITDDLAKAKAVFAYIKKNIKWNDLYATGSSGGKKALDSHSGDVGDINITLATALSAAGLNTEAVLLSTRGNGLINKLYPVENDFNYVVVKLNIGDKSYMLDATDPLMSFDMLPLKCLNDQGRVMSLDKPSYWIDLTTRQRKAQTSAYELTMQNDGKIKGTITVYSTGYEAYEGRKAIKKFNSEDEYVENLDERLAKIKILKSEITNVDSLDLPLTEKYEVEIDAFDNLNHNKLSFNPYILGRITNNPFKLNERTFPVDWGMPSDDRFVLIMHLPTDYVVDSAPQATALALPNAGGKFINNFTTEGNSFTFSNALQFNKSVYETEEYPYLKELYNKIIATEKSEIVFKKK
ncbi:transglutaminase [Mucilaginibacter sp. PAMC 26640]|nr:transglutaminase [Mucilaginibacter sp. PAMC 26640]